MKFVYVLYQIIRRVSDDVTVDERVVQIYSSRLKATQARERCQAGVVTSENPINRILYKVERFEVK